MIMDTLGLINRANCLKIFMVDLVESRKIEG